jgi:hypothetical protein
MKITSPKGKIFRLSFHTCDIILYSKFPYKFRKVVYPNGPIQMATGAFSWNQSPSKRRTAHGIYKKFSAEGADGVVDGNGDNAVPPAPVDDRQVPDVST